MKKCFAIFFAAISLLLLASCGKNESHKLQFTIPAGTSETFAFSNQEISPTGSKITLSTDTEVVIKFSQVREVNSYEMITEPLVQGIPVEIPLEKDTWYKMGVTIESPSDVDTVVSIEIYGIEVRAETSIPAGAAFSEIITTETSGEEMNDPLTDFSAIVPDADIYDSLACDLDNNGEDDSIILYSVDNGSESISAGLSVCLSNSLYSAINLDSNNELTFASGITLTNNNNTPVVSVDLKDPASGTIYTYVIEYTIDSAKREVNYAISSTIKIE